jgi:hypothetical protein
MGFNDVQESTGSQHSHCWGRRFEASTAHQKDSKNQGLAFAASPFLLVGMKMAEKHGSEGISFASGHPPKVNE